jgi:hypothetical protein
LLIEANPELLAGEQPDEAIPAPAVRKRPVVDPVPDDHQSAVRVCPIGQIAVAEWTHSSLHR